MGDTGFRAKALGKMHTQHPHHLFGAGTDHRVNTWRVHSTNTVLTRAAGRRVASKVPRGFLLGSSQLTSTPHALTPLRRIHRHTCGNTHTHTHTRHAQKLHCPTDRQTCCRHTHTQKHTHAQETCTKVILQLPQTHIQRHMYVETPSNAHSNQHTRYPYSETHTRHKQACSATHRNAHSETQAYIQRCTGSLPCHTHRDTPTEAHIYVEILTGVTNRYTHLFARRCAMLYIRGHKGTLKNLEAVSTYHRFTLTALHTHAGTHTHPDTCRQHTRLLMQAPRQACPASQTGFATQTASPTRHMCAVVQPRTYLVTDTHPTHIHPTVQHSQACMRTHTCCDSHRHTFPCRHAHAHTQKSTEKQCHKYTPRSTLFTCVHTHTHKVSIFCQTYEHVGTDLHEITLIYTQAPTHVHIVRHQDSKPFMFSES